MPRKRECEASNAGCRSTDRRLARDARGASLQRLGDLVQAHHVRHLLHLELLLVGEPRDQRRGRPVEPLDGVAVDVDLAGAGPCAAFSALPSARSSAAIAGQNSSCSAVSASAVFMRSMPAAPSRSPSSGLRLAGRGRDRHRAGLARDRGGRCRIARRRPGAARARTRQRHGAAGARRTARRARPRDTIIGMVLTLTGRDFDRRRGRGGERESCAGGCRRLRPARGLGDGDCDAVLPAPASPDRSPHWPRRRTPPHRRRTQAKSDQFASISS